LPGSLVAPGTRPVFYYDLGSAEAWLLAERVNGLLPEVPVWQPVHLPVQSPADPAAARNRIEARARALGLPPVRWPVPWPAQTRTAMLAAAFAQSAGRAVAFSLAAFRQAFAAGRDLGDVDTVLLAAAACELHPRAVLKALESRAVAERLERAGAEAAGRGVRRTPALAVGSLLHEGEEGLERLLSAWPVARGAPDTIG
jgi:2-hydroxychromene-2-carboxylate isomerase